MIRSLKTIRYQYYNRSSYREVEGESFLPVNDGIYSWEFQLVLTQHKCGNKNNNSPRRWAIVKMVLSRNLSPIVELYQRVEPRSTFLEIPTDGSL